MFIEESILKKIEVYVKAQNIQLFKLIAENENWDFKELCKRYL